MFLIYHMTDWESIQEQDDDVDSDEMTQNSLQQAMKEVVDDEDLLAGFSDTELRAMEHAGAELDDNQGHEISTHSMDLAMDGSAHAEAAGDDRGRAVVLVDCSLAWEILHRPEIAERLRPMLDDLGLLISLEGDSVEDFKGDVVELDADDCVRMVSPLKPVQQRQLLYALGQADRRTSLTERAADEAWAIISDEKYIKEDALLDLKDDRERLGLSVARDIFFLTDSEICHLASLCKKVFQSKMLKAFGLK